MEGLHQLVDIISTQLQALGLERSHTLALLQQHCLQLDALLAPPTNLFLQSGMLSWNGKREGKERWGRDGSVGLRRVSLCVCSGYH